MMYLLSKLHSCALKILIDDNFLPKSPKKCGRSLGRGEKLKAGRWVRVTGFLDQLQLKDILDSPLPKTHTSQHQIQENSQWCGQARMKKPETCLG